MSEQVKEDPELRAKLLTQEYLELGPEAPLGGIDAEALSEAIEFCSNVPSLPPKERFVLGWMHTERACGRFGDSQEGAAEAIEADLSAANQLFSSAAQSARDGSPLSIRAQIARQGLPIFGLWLGDYSPQETLVMKNQSLYEIFKVAKEAREAARTNQSNGSTYLLNMLATLWDLSDSALEKDSLLLLPSPCRSQVSQGRGHADWHMALANKGSQNMARVRLAPVGPSDYVLVPGSQMSHTKYDARRPGGALSAQIDLAEFNARNFGYRQQHLRNLPTPQAVTEAEHHVTSVRQGLRECIMPQLKNEWHVPLSARDNPQQWYRDLPPFADPAHDNYRSTFEQAISELELEVMELGEKIDPAKLMLLGSMNLEMALSIAANQDGLAARSGIFEHAEELFAAARDRLEEAGVYSARYEAAMSAHAAKMYSALTVDTSRHEQAVGEYFFGLASLAIEMLEAYPKLLADNPVDADAVVEQLQQITACLVLGSGTGYEAIVLPGSPRQRGSANAKGWDFTVWTREGDGTFKPGIFFGRIDDKKDPAAIYDNIISVGRNALGQWPPARHDFGTLRDVIAVMYPELADSPRTLDERRFRSAFRALEEISDASEAVFAL